MKSFVPIGTTIIMIIYIVILAAIFEGDSQQEKANLIWFQHWQHNN